MIIGSKRAYDILTAANLPNAIDPQIVRAGNAIDGMNIDRDRIGILLAGAELEPNYQYKANVRVQQINIEISTTRGIDVAHSIADDVIQTLLADDTYNWSVFGMSELSDNEATSRRAGILLTTEIQT